MMTLNEALEKSGMTAYKLSKLSGVSESQISRIRHGEIKIENLTAKAAMALADSLGVDLKELLKD